MGSVGQGGSVDRRKILCRSSACSRRAGLSAVLKIRVSVVRFRPGHHPHFFETHGFSGIAGGPSARAGGEIRPTIGLPDFGSMAARRVD